MTNKRQNSTKSNQLASLNNGGIYEIKIKGLLDNHLILLSPIAVILLGQLAARTLAPVIGIWSWVPLNIGYWSVIVLLVAWGGGRATFIRWFQPSRGSWY